MTDLVFVHGSGRSGADSWPRQVALYPDAHYFVAPGFGSEPPQPTDMDEWVRRLVALSPSVIVAASYGGIPAVLAATGLAAAGTPPRALVLLEPALYGPAAHLPAPAAHIALLSPLYERAPRMAPFDFMSEWTQLLGTPYRPPIAASARIAEDRMRLLAPPWTYSPDLAVIAAVPTTVVTGGTNEEYEQIASLLVENGATHLVIPGASHRVQDASAFDAILADVLATH
jgi:hypothetical protein